MKVISSFFSGQSLVNDRNDSKEETRRMDQMVLLFFIFSGIHPSHSLIGPTVLSLGHYVDVGPLT